MVTGPELWVRIGEPVRDPSERRLGVVEAVVMSPTLGRMTHASVAPTSALEDARLVPIAELRPGDGVLVMDSARWPDGYPATYEVEQLPYEQVHSPYPYDGMLPFEGVDQPSGTVRVVHEQLPDGQVALRADVPVAANDGHIGHAAGFLVHPETTELTHVLLRHGHLWGRRTVILPMELVSHVEEGTLVLRAAKQDVDRYAID